MICPASGVNRTWRRNVWLVPALIAMQQFVRYRRRGGHRADAANRSLQTIATDFALQLNVRFQGGLCCKILFGGAYKIFQRHWCAHHKIMSGGSHDQFDFQPAAFVSSLYGIGSWKTRFDGDPAKFCRHLIFEFCNTIRGQSDSWRRAAHSTNLTDLTYLAVHRGATQPKTLAYVINVNFEVEKQIGVPYRHSQIVGRPIDSLQVGLKCIELRDGKVCLHTCLDIP